MQRTPPMHAIRKRLTYANVMASVAMFIALGGTSLAAVQLGRNTVGSEQIVNSSVASGDIAPGGVRSSDIRNGTITHRDVRRGTLRGGDVATNTIDSRNLTDSGIHADDLDRDSVTGRAIRDGSITLADLADGTLPQLQKLDADLLDGKDSTEFLGATAQAADAAKLEGKTLAEVRAGIDADLFDGMDSTDFLGAAAKAADSDQLDGQDSTDFLGATAKAADSDQLDGQDSTDFLGATATAADSDQLDGQDSAAFQTRLVHALITPDQEGVIEGFSVGISDAQVTRGTDPGTGDPIHGLACIHGLGSTPHGLFGTPDEFGAAGNYTANEWSVVGAVDESPPECPPNTQAWAQIKNPAVNPPFAQSMYVMLIR